MAGTYTQIYIQCIFAVKGRENLLPHTWREEVFKYIQNQEEHHKNRTFRDEYLDLLKRFDVDYDERFLFEWYDD